MGASSYVQDSVSMMEELTTAIKNLKSKIESTVDRVNSKAESKLLAVKAIEELIGFGGSHENFVEKAQENSEMETTEEDEMETTEKPEDSVNSPDHENPEDSYQQGTPQKEE